MTLTADVAFGPISDGVPSVVVSNVQLDWQHVSLHCGGILGSILDALGVLLNTGIAKTEIQRHVVPMLESKVQRTINRMLGGLSLQFRINNGFAIADFSVLSTSLSSSAATLGVAAVLVPSSNPNINFPFPAPSVYDSCSGGMVNIGLSTYTFRTATYTYYQAGNLAFTKPAAIKAKDVELLLPGFVLAGGANSLLNFTVSALNAGAFYTLQSENALQFVMPMRTVLNGVNATVFDMHATATATLSVNVTSGASPSVFVGVLGLALANATVAHSNVGGWSTVPAILSLLDGIIRTAVLPLVDSFLHQHGFPLPTMMGYGIQNPFVSFVDNSICVAANLGHV